VVKRPHPAVSAAFLVALGLLAWQRWPRAVEAPAVRPPARVRAEAPLPRIGLDRLEGARAEAAPPSRDVFEFGRTPLPVEARPTPPPPAAGPASAAGVPAATVAAAGPPPLAVRYIGTVEQRGTRVAVLLSDDKKEVLTGREGETVANRLRIVRIGIESVDVQDLGSERVRRLPLKGN
jgi:hypothetical protein